MPILSLQTATPLRLRSAQLCLHHPGRILAWNAAAQRMYGWSEPEALAMNVRELIPKGLRKEALVKVQQLIRAETLSPCQTQRLTKDGRNITVWLTATPLVNKAGHVYAIATTE